MKLSHPKYPALNIQVMEQNVIELHYQRVETRTGILEVLLSENFSTWADTFNMVRAYTHYSVEITPP